MMTKQTDTNTGTLTLLPDSPKNYNMVENESIDPPTSRMQSARSTIWANPPM